MKALRDGGQPALRKLLESMKDIGSIEAATTKTPIKYAFARPVGGGRLVTVVTAKAIAAPGLEHPGRQAPRGVDVATAMLVLDTQDKGQASSLPPERSR